MSRTATVALTLLVLASLGFAPAPVYKERPGSAQDELKKLQGRWILVSRTRGGKTPSHCVHAVEVRGDRWTLSDKNGTWTSAFTFSLAVRKSPKQIDMKHDKHVSNNCGIYEVKGDRLEIAYSLNTGVRPTDFRGDSSKWSVDVYLREKP